MAKLSMTVSGETLAELAQNLVALGQELNSCGANTEVVEETTPVKRGRKKKEIEEETFEEAEETAEEEEAEPAEEEEETAEEEQEETPPAKKLTIADVVKHFRTYAERLGIDKAKKILKEFNVSASKDLKPKDWPAALKKLGVKV